MSNVSYTIHGGAWNDDEALARAVYRDFIRPDDRYYNVGFRAVEEHVIHVVRGGSWNFDLADACAATRNSNFVGIRLDDAGFRAVEEVKE